jgi:adenosine kinase
LERAIELGNLLAVHALETVGPQEYELKPAHLGERAAAAYGDASATAITAKLIA